MAVHYTERAALLTMPAAKKLVLMCIADSANQDNRVGFPGLDAIRQWAGIGRSRALEVIAELVDEGYLVRHRGGVNGRRAEFIVFPHGCCALHEPLPGYSASLPSNPAPRSAVPDPEISQGPVEGPVQGPVEGPVEGPVQSGPLHNYVTPPLRGTTNGDLEEVSHLSRGPVAEPSPVPPPPPPSPSPATPGDGLGQEPPPHCAEWPHPPRPCPPCGDARQANGAWWADELARRRDRDAAHRRQHQRERSLAAAELAACQLCDDEGTALVTIDGERVQSLCLHDPHRNVAAVAHRRAARAALVRRGAGA